MNIKEADEYIKNCSKEELLKIKSFIFNDKNYQEEQLFIANEQIESKMVSSDIKSEAYNDRKYANDKISKDEILLDIIEDEILKK